MSKSRQNHLKIMSQNHERTIPERRTLGGTVHSYVAIFSEPNFLMESPCDFFSARGRRGCRGVVVEDRDLIRTKFHALTVRGHVLERKGLLVVGSEFGLLCASFELRF